MQQKNTAGATDPESLVGFWINRASRAVIRALDARLRPLGFAMSYLPVMRALADGRSLSQKELAHLARVEQPTMAEMIVRMERDGVVLRKPNPDDKRGSLISLARPWRTRFPEARTVLLDGEREAMTGLSDSERATLRELLQRVVTNLEGGKDAEASEKSQPVPPAGDAPRGSQPRLPSRKRKTK